MSWTLAQVATNTANADYRSRVSAAFRKLAVDVTNEDTGTDNHVKRLALANQVISGTGVPPRCYELLPILNPALQVTVNDPASDPTDNDILFSVSQQWDFFAGE